MGQDLSHAFLIAGQPRTRTAWWSVAAVTPVSSCIHEPLAHCQSFDELRAEWAKPFEFVGISDSGLTLQLGRILDEIGPRTLIVDRPIGDIERSFDRYFTDVAFDRLQMRLILLRIEKQIRRFKSHPLVKLVPFEALRNWDVVEDCFRWLMPGNRHPPNRELQHMNIQVEVSHALAQMRKPHTHWHLKD